MLGTDIQDSGNFVTAVKLTRGQSLAGSQLHFNKISLLYSDIYNFKQDKIITNMRGGITSAETPLNYQFHGGGFSNIPLRGHNKDMAGDRFLAAFFLDSGKIIKAGNTFSQEDLLVDCGMGFSYDTPADIPVRFDMGYNLKQGNYNFNIS